MRIVPIFPFSAFSNRLHLPSCQNQLFACTFYSLPREDKAVSPLYPLHDGILFSMSGWRSRGNQIMTVISEWVKRAAHAHFIPHEKGFFKTKVLQTSQKNKVKTCGVFPRENTLVKQQNIARNRQESSCHYKISLCLIWYDRNTTREQVKGGLQEFGWNLDYLPASREIMGLAGRDSSGIQFRSDDVW